MLAFSQLDMRQIVFKYRKDYIYCKCNCIFLICNFLTSNELCKILNDFCNKHLSNVNVFKCLFNR